QQAGRREGALGSGVIVTPDGYILTNNHVVEGSKQVDVELSDGRTARATVVGADAPSDLAVLKVDLRGLPTVPVGDSDQVRVGDVALAFGNPLGVGQTVTMGIISAKGWGTGASKASSRPALPSTAETSGARSSTRAASSSGSTRRSSRPPAATSASASPSRPTWRRT